MAPSTRCIGDGKIQPLIGNPFLCVYKPLRTWVDDHPLLYGNNGSLDPGTYDKCSKPVRYMALYWLVNRDS